MKEAEIWKQLNKMDFINESMTVCVDARCSLLCREQHRLAVRTTSVLAGWGR